LIDVFGDGDDDGQPCGWLDQILTFYSAVIASTATLEQTMSLILGATLAAGVLTVQHVRTSRLAAAYVVTARSRLLVCCGMAFENSHACPLP
jgi:hypothetical protein